MTTQGANPEEFPTQREAVIQEVTLESRAPEIVMPDNDMWPMLLDDEVYRFSATEQLPQLVQTLSEPISPATQDQITNIFAQNPGQRRKPWTCTGGENGSYTFATEADEGQTDEEGMKWLYPGINYTFDQNGRLIKKEHIEGGSSYDRGRPNYQEFLTYDDEGYLIQRATWAKYRHPTVTDRFDYKVTADDTKSPTKMTRTIKIMGASQENKDSRPMTVDLANYEEWIAKNPNGFKVLTKKELKPQALQIKDFSVSERRKGILFTDPEQLEHALVMYGEGNYPAPGGETALEFNEQVFAEKSSQAGELFSLFTRRGDMGEFVQARIMNNVQTKWEAVQKSRKSDVCESVHFSFDYDGAGHFHKSSGEVEITKNGLELTLGAAYVGDKVEDQLASAMRKKRGLRSATIEIPVNQTEQDGYFMVDVRAVCDQLGILVTDEDISNYLQKYADSSLTDRIERQNGGQPTLWQDDKTGVSVMLVTQRIDQDLRVGLDELFDHDRTSIWGPLPKEILHISDDKRNTPRIRVTVKPSGDPFDEETTKRTDEIVGDYMSWLEQATA